MVGGGIRLLRERLPRGFVRGEGYFSLEVGENVADAFGELLAGDEGDPGIIGEELLSDLLLEVACYGS